MDTQKHLILHNANIKEALGKLNVLAGDAILFVVDHDNLLIGSLTDGDIRRGFLKGLTFDSPIREFIQPNPAYIRKNDYSIEQLDEYAKRNLKIIPILNERSQVIDVLNLRLKHSLLPLDTVLMAGGRGERLMPLTENCPKPLLKIGEKPIIEHNIDRMSAFGISRFFISIRYLGDQIKSHFGNGASKNIEIKYVEEDAPLGTFGALSMIDDFQTDHILLMNSDILTNIDLKDFYKSFLSCGADFMVASIPYKVNIPYAVLQIENDNIVAFDEKPTYSYYSNGGIYLFKKSLLELLTKGQFFNATDFMELLIARKCKVAHYPILGYWLDIGRHEDFKKAQIDIQHIQF